MTRDTAADVAAVLHPLPDPTPEQYAENANVYDTWREGIAEKQQRLAEQLRSDAEGSEGDPLLIALQNEVVAKQKAEANIRRLLAYGREFVRPRGYTLESLARASGMSFSGVRTAYDDREVGQVAKYTGTKPRDRRADPVVALDEAASIPTHRVDFAPLFTANRGRTDFGDAADQGDADRG
jgi:hypothetical protein